MTAILERAGSRSVVMPDGKRISGKRFMAVALWELVTTGSVTMPNGIVWVVERRDWLETVKWLYVHIDGAAKQQVDVMSDGESLAGRVTDEQRFAAVMGAFVALGTRVHGGDGEGPPAVAPAGGATD
jgi:hypothetical protein